MRERELTACLEGADKERITTHLEKLLPHLEENRFVFVGGLAIRFHLCSRGIPFPPRPLNDLDIIAESNLVVRPTVTKDFLVSHYHFHPHSPEHQDNFYIVLVDPQSKTKIDIFDLEANPPEKTVNVHFGDHLVRLVSLEDQLVTSVLEACRVLGGNINDPKQFADAKLLMQAADLDLAQRFWQRRRINPHKTTMLETLAQAEAYTEIHPELLVSNMYKKRQPYKCPVCIDYPGFPLTPMDEVFRILGYIE